MQNHRNENDHMVYLLRRAGDGLERAGDRSRAIMLNDYGVVEGTAGHSPRVGHRMLVGTWLTTTVIEILEETKSGTAHYVKFRTMNSVYEWREDVTVLL